MKKIKSVFLKFYQVTSWPIGVIIRVLRLDELLAAGIQFFVGTILTTEIGSKKQSKEADKE